MDSEDGAIDVVSSHRLIQLVTRQEIRKDEGVKRERHIFNAIFNKCQSLHHCGHHIAAIWVHTTKTGNEEDHLYFIEKYPWVPLQVCKWGEADLTFAQNNLIAMFKVFGLSSENARKMLCCVLMEKMPNSVEEATNYFPRP